MALPLAYSFRNAVVRSTSTLLTALGIALTVAVFAGIFALREGFQQIYRARGSADLAIYLREGAKSEGESGIPRDVVEILTKERAEVARDTGGRPLAAAESYLGIFMEKTAGGRTNVAVRGIQPMSIALQGDAFRVIAGRALEFGTNELMIGRPLQKRIRDCVLGGTITLNTTPFTIVGVFELPDAQGSEIWGDADRLMAVLQRPAFQRVIARVVPGADLKLAAREIKDDAHLGMAVKLLSEREYLAKQTGVFGAILAGLAVGLTFIMGIAAVLGAINTMLAAVATRAHEIGILRAIGYSAMSIFVAFLVEAMVIGVIGGVLGTLLVLPLNGIQTGLMNYDTFTDVTFAFRVTPYWLGISVLLAAGLGILGGVIPAFVAARRRPVDALRRT